MMNKKMISWMLSALCLPVSAVAMADEGTVTAGTGFNYSRGDYGTTATTRIRTTPLDLGYENGAWAFKLEIPYLDVSGPPNVIPGIGIVRNSNLNLRGGILGVPLGGSTPSTPSTSSTQTSGRARGIGDVTTAASWQVYENTDAQFGLGLSAKIKFGTADRDKGLGTGENDYGAAIDAWKKIARISLFGGVGYTKFGDSPYIDLKNAVNATAAAAFNLDDRSRLGIAYEYRQRVSDKGDPRREATLFYGYGQKRGWNTQLYVLKGFANGGADWGAGLTVANAF